MMTDELLHVIKGLVQQEIREIRPFVYAHISNYDPALHAVRVVVPSMRDEITNEPLMSGWLQLGTLQTGSGTGLQVAPVGGASLTDPTAGEQCLVALTDRGIGVASVIALFFNNKLQPPSTSISSPLQAGEMVAFSNGIEVRWNSDGTLTINSTKDVTVVATGNVNLTGNDVVVTGNSVVSIMTPTVNLAAGSGRAVVRDGDPVVNGVVKASTTSVYSG